MSDYSNETEWPRARLLDELEAGYEGIGGLVWMKAGDHDEVTAIRAELNRRADAAEARVRELEAAAVALLDALPKCEWDEENAERVFVGCGRPATMEHLAYDRKSYGCGDPAHNTEDSDLGSVSLPWAEPAEALRKLVGR